MKNLATSNESATISGNVKMGINGGGGLTGKSVTIPDFSKQYSRIFWCVAILYGMVWTFLPFLLEPNFRYDVIEMFFVGKEGVIATFKHPALNSIIL
ncbi:MAG: hypothetical protein LBQ50_08525, partial [Planctomycetaceae bacterium]|nr:hypothetical protein [Planctomycetaceae bacterium]